MKAPICKLCHYAHYAYQPHIFSAAQQPPIDNVTTVVTSTPFVCNQCVTKDAEIGRLRNQLADALKRVAEWMSVTVEVDKNHRKAAKRDRAAYMREYRSRA